MDTQNPPKSSRSERTLPLPASTDSALLAAAKRADNVYGFGYTTTGDEAKGQRITRPALPVRLLDHELNHVAKARAIVDSGADHTTLSGDWAEILGIELEKDCFPIKAEVAGKPTTHWAFGTGLEVEVLGEPLFLPIAVFCPDLPVLLLGRRDFMERYFVMIDEPNKRFYIERRPDLDPADGPDISASREERAKLARKKAQRDGQDGGTPVVL